MLRNTLEKYGTMAKSLHWIVGLLIIIAWIVGYYAIDLPKDDPQKGVLFNLHKSVGMVILMLVVIRFCWRLYDINPRTPSSLTKMQAWLAHAVHYLLYLFMFIQPLSGWAMSSAAGYNPTFFGLFTFPALVEKNPANVEFYVDMHNTSAYILLALFVLHIVGALYHYFYLKDNTLQRMV
jgi:cytochrome b561